jgi:hypothetical protein
MKPASSCGVILQKRPLGGEQAALKVEARANIQ